MQRTCALLTHVTCRDLHCFPTLSYKRHDFRKKNLFERKMCLEFANLSEIIFIPRRTERHTIKNVYWSLREVPFIRVRFQ